MNLRRGGLILLLLVAGPAVGQWSGQFARLPELAIVTMAETPQGLVAAGRPIQYVSDSGDVEFHVLRFYQDGEWTTGGDIEVAAFSGAITTVAPYREDYCVGGSFTNFSPGGFNFFACYATGSGEWYQPGGNGNGPNNAVNSIWFDGSVNLYIGGEFTEVDDDQGVPFTANRVARTTGAVWEPLTGDGGATNGVAASVKVVRTFNGFVFVVSGANVFRYNPTNTTWTPFGIATFNMALRVLDDLVFYDNEVVVSGPYNTIGGESAPGVATSSVASGPDWLPLDDGSQGHGSGEPLMAANSSYIYVVGPWPDLVGADGLARFTGFNWEAVDTSALGSNVAGTLVDVVTQPELEICVRHGGLNGATLGSAGIACKQEPSGPWRGTSQGMEGSVQALAAYQGSVFAGGSFLSAGDDFAASVVARWDGNRWSAVGAGVTGEVNSLAVFRGELFAAGNVNGAGGNATGGLVAWNGSSWRDAGGPGALVSSPLYALGNTLYFFGVAGNCGSVLSAMCRYDGINIEEAAGGLPEPVSVNAIGEYQGRLVVAGNFRFNGGARQDVIAVLDNGGWEVIVSLSPGGGVTALGSDSDFLYFGGQFTSNVGGAPEPLNGVGRWDGGSLSALGSGLSGGLITRVKAFAKHEGRLFVAGDFESAGGVLSRGIASWDGSSWSGLQGGLVDTPFPGLGIGTISPGIGNALLSTSQGLYVGGTFDQTGNRFGGNVGLFTGSTLFNNGFEVP